MNRIKELRKKFNINQEALANIINVETSVISRYESEKIPLRVEQVIALCKYFNVTSDYLLGLTNINNTDYSLINTIDNENAFLLENLGISKEDLMKLSKESKEKLKEFIKFVNYEEKNK